MPDRFGLFRLLCRLVLTIARYLFAALCEAFWDAAYGRRRVGWSTFRKIYWGPLLCIFILFVLSTAVSIAMGGRRSSEHPLLTALACAFWVWLLLGRPIAYLLVPLLVSTLSCPGCGEEIDAVGVWNCACGFHHHRERHILAGRCPLCGKTAGHVNCPHCDCTILLW